MSKRVVVLLALSAVAAMPAAAAAQAPPQHLLGAVHEHSGYSDGWPGSRPADYFASARRHGLAFLGSSEHSTNADLPFVFNEECLDPRVAPKCQIADPVNPADSFRKWEATLEQAEAATTREFTGFRGFEWTSDRQGHINVYLSHEDSRPEADGGDISVRRFYDWLTTTGSDGLATFNHPGDKSICGQLGGCEPASDPAFNWEDFRYVPEADPLMVGIEVFNGGSDFGSAPGHNAPPEGWYARALDRGWHVGAIGAEDKGHRRTDDWGAPEHAKTVILASANTRGHLRQAMADRRFYAVLDNALRLDFSVDDEPMGARLKRPRGAELPIEAHVRGSLTPLTLELVSSRGRVVASATGDALRARRHVTRDEPWYFLRVRRGPQSVAYSSPVWVEPQAPADRGGGWLAGDLHVHTCFSHDAFCAGIDDPSENEPGRQGVDVHGRFGEAAGRGLDYLAITDHNDVRSVTARGFGSRGLIGIPGYENSIRGHAQVLGSTELLDNGDGSPDAIRELADRLHDRGGVLQANHPGYRLAAPFANCDTTPLHWTYGFDVRPDTIEVWNPTSSIRAAEDYLECWLQRGERVTATGGSDAHLLLTQAVGAGYPTTWVLARERSARGVLAALRAGRSSISSLPPAIGGRPLVIERDAGWGRWEPAIGETVEPGTRLRARSLDPLANGELKVRANGETLLDRRLGPGDEIRFRAPRRPGWVRAVLRLAGDALERSPLCAPTGQSLSLCPYDRALVGMTSPVYVAERR